MSFKGLPNVPKSSLDIDSIVRQPTPEARFQISCAPGALTLAGSNEGETIERVQVSGVRPSRFAREQVSVLRKRNRVLTPEHCSRAKREGLTT